MSTVLITRPQPQADALAEKLKRQGFTAYAAPLIEYKALATDIDDPEKYQGVIFTSVRAVQEFSKEEKQFQTLPVFCVGAATAEAATAAGFETVFSADGDAGDLVQLIRDKKTEMTLHRLLHISGVDVARDLGKALLRDNITVDRVAVYKAELIDALPPAAERALKLGEIDTVLLFSARAAEHFTKRMAAKKMRAIAAGTTLICMSARVAAHLGGVDWKAVRVAEAPEQDSMLVTLYEVTALPPVRPSSLPSAPFIKAFGGIRPLAQALDLTPSTVQGWKKRGVVPENRVDAILKAAENAGADSEKLLQDAIRSMEEKEKKPSDFPERRTGRDRRVKTAKPDEKGVVQTDAYTGPERRAKERRAHKARQKKRVRQEKLNFLNRTTLSIAFILVAFSYAGYFLLAPEIVEMNRNAMRVAEMEQQLQALEARLQKQEKMPMSLAAKLNNRIGSIETSVKDARHKSEDMASKAAAAVTQRIVSSVAPSLPSTITGIEPFLEMLSSVQALKKTPHGRRALDTAMMELTKAIDVSDGNPDHLNTAVDLARNKDPILNDLLTDIKTQDLAAVALLLGMNELRSRLDRQQPFDRDLDMVKKIAVQDPKMLTALDQLAPYAENGVLTRQTLQEEFKGLAGDIVMAKLSGEDLSVKERALKRLQNFVKLRKIDDTEGDSVDAVVARAQLLLDQGDVAGAVKALNTLDGPSAEVAAPWIEKAGGHLVVDDASDKMSQMIIQTLTEAALQQNFSLPGMLSSMRTYFVDDSSKVLYMSPAMLEKDNAGSPSSVFPPPQSGHTSPIFPAQ